VPHCAAGRTSSSLHALSLSGDQALVGCADIDLLAARLRTGWRAGPLFHDDRQSDSNAVGRRRSRGASVWRAADVTVGSSIDATVPEDPGSRGGCAWMTKGYDAFRRDGFISTRSSARSRSR
jgi:hypothetical protein